MWRCSDCGLIINSVPDDHECDEITFVGWQMRSFEWKWPEFLATVEGQFAAFYAQRMIGGG